MTTTTNTTTKSERTLADYGFEHGDSEQCIGCGEGVILRSVRQIVAEGEGKGEVLCSACRRGHRAIVRSERRAVIAAYVPPARIAATCAHEWSTAPTGLTYCTRCLSYPGEV